MDFFDVVKKRVSVREYSNRLVVRDDIKQIIDAGHLAATARNEQPWRFVVVVDKPKIEQLSRMVLPNGAFMIGAAAAIVVLSADTKYYLEDCSAATQNMLLAATSLGIGACWIAGDKKNYADSVAILVQGHPGERLVSIVAIGYPEKPVTSKPKKTLDGLISWL